MLPRKDIAEFGLNLVIQRIQDRIEFAKKTAGCEHSAIDGPGILISFVLAREIVMACQRALHFIEKPDNED